MSDWEAQKQRLLASLEDEDGDAGEEARKERLSIESTIRITDEVVADKDREIAELKRLLEDQTSSIGDVAIGAGAVAQLFDADEAIQQERDRLAELKTQWEGKLRQAELEISVQRAKCARERAEIDEHRRELSDLEQRLKELQEASGDDSSAARPKRRWLARLGLNRDEE
jgi:hypothetical protein